MFYKHSFFLLGFRDPHTNAKPKLVPTLVEVSLGRNNIWHLNTLKPILIKLPFFLFFFFCSGERSKLFYLGIFSSPGTEHQVPQQVSGQE